MVQQWIYEDKGTEGNKKWKTLQPWLLMSLDSQVFCLKKKKKTNARNMLCCAILFCTFPDVHVVGYRENPIQEERSAFNVQGLEKPLGVMKANRQGLRYFLTCFSFLSIIWGKGLGWWRGWGLYPPWSNPREQWQEDSGRTCVLQQNGATARASGAPGLRGHT